MRQGKRTLRLMKLGQSLGWASVLSLADGQSIGGAMGPVDGLEYKAEVDGVCMNSLDGPTDGETTDIAKETGFRTIWSQKNWSFIYALTWLTKIGRDAVHHGILKLPTEFGSADDGTAPRAVGSWITPER